MIEEFFREDIKNFKPYDAKKENYEIKLDANESFITFSKEIRNEILESLGNVEFNRYPDPNATELCKAYSRYINIDVKNIMAGNGSDELIQILVGTFLDKKDKIAMLNPDFSMYRVYTEIRGGEVITFNLDDNFKLDVDEFIKYINKERPKMFIFSNPNNPTGGVIPKKDIIKIIENANCIVVVDEAYMEFYGDSIVDCIKKYDNLIVLRTASKALGSAALRLGFLITNEVLLREIQKVKPPFNVNSVSQAIGRVILKNTTFIKQCIEKTINERNYLSAELKNVEGVKSYPTQSNFILIQSRDINNINEKLLKKGIKVRTFKDQRLKNCMRINAGNREENEKLICAIRS